MQHSLVAVVVGCLAAIGLPGRAAEPDGAPIEFRTVWSVAVGGGMESGELAPDGRTCALGLTGKGVRLWRTVDARELRSFPLYTDPCDQPKCQELECLAWSADGTGLAVGGNSRPVKIIEVATGREVLSLETVETDGIRGHPGGRFFAIADGGTLLIVQTPEMKVVSRTAAHGCGINSIDFSRDGRWMVTGACDAKIVVWSVDGIDLTRVASLSAPASVKTVRITADGQYILGACGGAEKVVLWKREGGQVAEVAVPGYCDHAEFSPDGSVLVTQAKGENLLVYRVPDLRLLQSLPRGGNGESMHWVGRQLLVVGGGLVTLYQTSSGALPLRPGPPRGQPPG